MKDRQGERTIQSTPACRALNKLYFLNIFKFLLKHSYFAFNTPPNFSRNQLDFLIRTFTSPNFF